MSIFRNYLERLIAAQSGGTVDLSAYEGETISLEASGATAVLSAPAGFAGLSGALGAAVTGGQASMTGLESLELVVGDGSLVVRLEDDAGTEGLGFWGAPPIVKPTGVAVTAEAIHAALVSYGLIAGP